MYLVIQECSIKNLSKYNKDVLSASTPKEDATFLIFCGTFVQIIIFKFACIPIIKFSHETFLLFLSILFSNHHNSQSVWQLLCTYKWQRRAIS